MQQTLADNQHFDKCLEVARRVSSHAAPGHDLHDILKDIAAAAREIASARHASVLVYDDQGGIAHHVSDGPQDTRASRSSSNTLEVAVTSQERKLGAIRVAREDGGAFAPHEEVALTLLAGQTALAIKSWRLARENLSAQRSLRSDVISQTRLQAALLDSVRESVIATDIEGRVVYWSRGAEALYGYAADEVMGRPIPFIVKPEEEEAEIERIKHALAHGSWTGRYVQRRKDGSAFWADTAIFLIRDDSGDPIGFVGIDRDVTEQVEAQGSQRRLAEENAVLAEIGRIVNSSLDIYEVYERLSREIKKLIPFDRISISLIDHERSLLKNTYIMGLDIPERREGNELPLPGTITQQALRSGGPILANLDSEGQILERFPGLLPIFRAGLRCNITVPLVSRDRPLGALNLMSLQPGAYSQRHVELAEHVGNQIAGAIANSQLYASLHRETVERGVLAQIGRIVSSSLDISDVYERFATEVRKLVPFDRISIGVVDEVTGTLEHAYVLGMDIPGWRPGERVTLAESIYRFGNAPEQPRIFEDPPEELLSDAPPGLRAAVQAGLRWGISVPLKSGNKIIGNMVIRSKTANVYMQHHLEMAERVGDQIAGAIASIQLHRQLQREAEEREALARIGRITRSSLDTVQVFERLGSELHKLIPFDRMSIGMVDPSEGALVHAYTKGVDIPGWQVGDGVPLSASGAEEMLKTGRGCVQSLDPGEVSQDDSHPERSAVEAGLLSMMAVPLFFEGRPIGTLCVRAIEPNAYNSRDLDLLERVGTQVAGTIANARLHRDLQREADARRGLARIGRIVSSSLDIEDVYERFAEEVRRLIPYDRLALTLSAAESDAYFTNYSAGLQVPERASGKSFPATGSITKHVMETRESLVMHCASQEEVAARFPGLLPLYQAGLRSQISVPLLHRGQAVGALHLSSCKESAYSTHDLELAERIGGQIAGAIANTQLYADLKAAGQALRASEAQFRTLAEATAAATFVYRDNRFLYVNSRAQEITGYTHDELVSLDFHNLIHPDSLKAVEEVSQARKHGKLRSTRFELKILARGGAEVWLDVAAAHVEFDGKPAVLGTAFDITQRKHYEEAVQRERARLQAVLDTSPVGLFVVDASGNVLFANRELERVLGITHDVMKTAEAYWGATTLVNADGTPCALQDRPLWRTLNRGERVVAEEMKVELPGGRRVPVLINVTPLYGSEGRLAGAIMAVQDLTALEETERLRSEFLSVVSHEIGTPLAAIKGAAVTALGSRKSLDPLEAYQLFHIIEEQADEIRELVDNLLDITRIDAGALSLTPETLDLKSVLVEAQTSFIRSAGLVNEVVIKADDDLPRVRADRRRITQVLINLLTNAARFSRPGDPITLEAAYDSVYVTLSVRDQGEGIPPDRLPHVFEKSTRHQEGWVRGGSGVGLALAISKGIVEAHGGRIWAESAGRGKGAVFSFTMPVASDNADSRPVAVIERIESPVKGKNGNARMKVLAVDDEPRTLRILQRVLDGAGFQVTATTDPSQVVESVEIEDPDILILDIRFPGTSGFDLLKRIREFSSLPVIFLTASGEEGDAVRALHMGADDYIRKPFSPPELLARIEAILRRRSLASPSESRPPFVLHDLRIDFAQRQVTVKGREVSLSATEYKLLYELATHAGRLLTHDQILQSVWGSEYTGGETETIRTFIRNLRRQLGDDARNPRYIVTERGVGYMMPSPSRGHEE